MARGKKTNPLFSKEARIAPVPGRTIDMLEVKTLSFQYPPKLWAQQEAFDITANHFKEEVKELNEAYDFWLAFRGPAEEYYQASQYDGITRHVLTWPYLTKEIIEAMKSHNKYKPYLDKTGGFADPWANYSYLTWPDAFLQTLMYGPNSQKILVEKYLPALEKYLMFCKKYNSEGKTESVDNILTALRHLHKGGIFRPEDAVMIRKRMHSRFYESHGRKISWGKELEAKWDDAAKEVLSQAETFRANGETPTGLQLLVAFTQQLGVPFKTAVHDALLDPDWTKNL